MQQNRLVLTGESGILNRGVPHKCPFVQGIREPYPVISARAFQEEGQETSLDGFC